MQWHSEIFCQTGQGMPIFRMYMIIFRIFYYAIKMNWLAFKMAWSVLIFTYTRVAIYEPVVFLKVVIFGSLGLDIFCL